MKEFLNLIRKMEDNALDKKTSGDEDENEEISNLENDESDKLKLGESPSLFRSSRSAYDSNSWPDRNAGLAHPSINQSYRPTPEQNKTTNLVRDTVGPTHGDPKSSRAEGGQPRDDAAGLDNRNVDPKRSNAGDDQVRLEIQFGKQKLCCISVQTQLLNLLQSTLEKYRQLHLSFQSLLSPSHQLTNELLI